MNGLSSVINLIRQPLGKRVDQKLIEQWASTFWRLLRKTSRSKPPRNGCPFVILFPPPNITGNLHLGHALTGAIQDALVRQKRMQGFQCLFIPGFDHAGLATQSIVERLLLKQKSITRQMLGREEFVAMTNKWKDQKRSEMRKQLDRLGLELDYDKEYFTMDANSSLAVQAAFKQLFNSRLIYRSTKPIFWSEQLQSTLSDIEVEEVDGLNRYIRTGEVVSRRPISQWFISAESMAQRAVGAVEDGRIEIIPQNYKNSWSSWLTRNGVEDWCISRQSWWGHRIPAYRLKSSPDGDHSSWVVAESMDEAKSLLNPIDDNDVIQDPDVLDTWFSSSLLPLSISGWPNEEKFAATCKKGEFPLQIMETGFDILTFWVSKMAMVSLALTDLVPFKLILLHGMICDSDGKKMSKSKGNVIDPIDVIDGCSLKYLQDRTRNSHSQGLLEDSVMQSVLDNQKRLFPKGIPLCGADGLRSYLLSHDVLEEVVRIQIDQIDKVRRLANKIWNVYRFVVMNSDTHYNTMALHAADTSMLSQDLLDSDDRQLLSALAKCVSVSHEVFNETYQFHYCFIHLERFWTVHLSHDYIGNVRNILLKAEGDNAQRMHKLQVLYISLVTSIKLLHPFMPHLTEFLHQKLAWPNSKDLDDSMSADMLLINQAYPKKEHWVEFLQ